MKTERFMTIALAAFGAVCMLFTSCGKEGTEPEPTSKPLTFTDDEAYDIPTTTVDTAITDINVAPGVSGGKTPYTFTATGLPAGITISAAGVISGTPTEATPAGTATVTVEDSSTPVQSKGITIAFGEVAAALPVITGHPADASIPQGGTTTFSVTATGATSYQWEFSNDGGISFMDALNNVYNSGVATQTLTVTDFVSVGIPNGNQYRCRVSNDAGDVYSDPATLTITSE